MVILLQDRKTEDRTAGLVAELLEIWESSVRATHSFLSEKEMENIKRYVPRALREVPHLLVAEENGVPVAFAAEMANGGIVHTCTHSVISLL